MKKDEHSLGIHYRSWLTPITSAGASNHLQNNSSHGSHTFTQRPHANEEREEQEKLMGVVVRLGRATERQKAGPST